MSARCRWRIQAALLIGVTACGGEPGATAGGPQELVFRHFEVPGGSDRLDALLATFQRDHPDIVLRERVLPSSSDQQHQFYVTNLEAGGADFDVLAVDVIWVAEFARAGWLLPVDDVLSSDDGADFLPGPLQACTFDGRLFAVPWFVDGGLLYYRKDLLARAGLQPPDTYADLAASVPVVRRTEPDLMGFLWQGRQYEGLVCVALELVHAHGGALIADGAPALQRLPAQQALATLRTFVEDGTSPPLVTTLDEEGARRLFQAGRALYMRNWPYAWSLLQSEGSPVRGKVGIAPMPRFEHGHHVATLGGWQLAIARDSKHPAAAKALLRFLATADAQRQLTLATGLQPARRSVYHDPEVSKARPFTTRLLDILEHAEPRPVTPFYPMITAILQSELSAIVAGIRDVATATHRAQVQIEHVLELDR